MVRHPRINIRTGKTANQAAIVHNVDGCSILASGGMRIVGLIPLTDISARRQVPFCYALLTYFLIIRMGIFSLILILKYIYLVKEYIYI